MDIMISASKFAIEIFNIINNDGRMCLEKWKKNRPKI
jgi:hypothetical protein